MHGCDKAGNTNVKNMKTYSTIFSAILLAGSVSLGLTANAGISPAITAHSMVAQSDTSKMKKDKMAKDKMKMDKMKMKEDEKMKMDKMKMDKMKMKKDSTKMKM